MPKLDAITNIAILLTCSLITGYMVGHQVRTPPARQQPASTYLRGDRVPDSARLALSKWHATIILVTASTCRACSLSAPFYRRLLPAAAASGVTVVAVTEEPEHINRAYLASQDLKPDHLVTLSENP